MIYHVSISVMPGGCSIVNSTSAAPPNNLDAGENRRLRVANGIRDSIVFPRLRALGVAESDLHAFAMALVRVIQYRRDSNGQIATLLGVIPCGINGTAPCPEVA